MPRNNSMLSFKTVNDNMAISYYHFLARVVMKMGSQSIIYTSLVIAKTRQHDIFHVVQCRVFRAIFALNISRKYT